MDFNILISNKIMQTIQEITNVIRINFRMSYYRLVAHLKFFAKRIFTEQESSDEIQNTIIKSVQMKNFI